MLEIKTTILQDMVNKAVRGASNNKLIPLTSYMRLRVTPSAFSILTTDGMDYLEVMTDLEGYGSEEDAVVLADTFTRLVRKLTGDTVKFNLTDKYLVVECNGTYKFELLLDDEGEPVNFTMPNEFDGFEGKEKVGELDRATLTRIMNSLKQSLAVDTKRPQYCSYRVGDEIIATDTALISVLNTKAFETARLVSAECMNLLDAVVEDNGVAVGYKVGDAVVYDCGHAVLYSREPNGLENFNVASIKGFADAEFPRHCTVSTQALIDTFERIALFVGAYDVGAVTLVFDESNIMISSKNTSGVESIAYETVDAGENFTCIADVNSLLAVFKAQPSEVVDLYFGDSATIKIKDGDLTTILALMY